MYSSHLKYWMLFLVALAWFGTEVNGQVFELGRCPSPTAVADFDVTKYTGKWYNNRNYFAIFQAQLDCITAVYETSGSGISVTNEGYNLSTRQKSTAIGTGTLIAPGKIGVSFSGTPGQFRVRCAKFDSLKSTSANYWVLGTDYDRYAVVWSCTQLGPIRISFAWILTRDAEPVQAVVDDGLAVFAKYGINTAPLKVTNQKNCPTS